MIVAGLSRSGTIWLANCLSFAPGFTSYREPDNYHEAPGAGKRFRDAYPTADRGDPAYRRLLTRAVAGQVVTAFTMKHDPGPLLRQFRGPGPVVGERLPWLFRREPHVLWCSPTSIWPG